MNDLVDRNMRRVAEPGQGYDAKAAEWRAKLDAATAKPANDAAPEQK